MKDTIDRLIIPGRPFGKERPRKAKFLQGLYTPAKTLKYEAYIREIATKLTRMYPGPVKVDITAVFEVPKSYSKKRRQACLEGKEMPTKKPDKDNIEKIVLDGLNPLYRLNKRTHKKELVKEGLYLDDKQVVAGETKKIYGEEPRVEVVIQYF